MSEQTEQGGSIPVWFLIMIASVLIVAILWVGRGFFIPLAVTGLLFILSSALVDRWKKASIAGRALPNWCVSLLSAGTVIGAIGVFAMIIGASTDEVQSALAEYQNRLSAMVGQLEQIVGARYIDALRTALSGVDLGAWVAAAASEVGSSLSMVTLIILYLAFLVSERTAWSEKLPLLANSPEGAAQFRAVLDRISYGVKQYMWVNAVTSAMSGLVAFAIFKWIGLDFAPLLALIVFVVGFIPNIGAFIGIALPSLVALIQFDSLTPFLIVLFGYGLSDQFIANVIQPSMQGKSLNMSTFMVMVALTFWATLWGGLGAFLAVPMMVVVMVICAEIPAMRWLAVLLSGDGKIRELSTEM